MSFTPAEFSVQTPVLQRASEKPGVWVFANRYYTRSAGIADMLQYGLSSRSDLTDVEYRAFSDDGGETWSKPDTIVTNRPVEGGTLRKTLGPCWADPDCGVLVNVYTYGVLPTDHPLEGMKHYTIRYALSSDGGKTWFHDGPVVHEGGEYDEGHPLPGVRIGHNGVMLGDMGSTMVKLQDGTLLQPIQVMPAGPDGEYHNPGGGFTWTDAALLRGRWNADNTRIRWTVSEYVHGDPERTTRGMIEPTVAEMPDGRVLMVMRGSNDAVPQWPAWRWFSVSTDGGATFTAAEPWTFHGDTSFYSPSSMSALVPHSSGRVFWVGNLSRENCSGNNPRHPLVCGEVHPESLRLVEETLVTIDAKREGDAAAFALSNFSARENRQTGGIDVFCSPWGRGHETEVFKQLGREPDDHEHLWTADSYVYHIAVTL